MPDALNQMIPHKREETSHCSVDAGHHVTVLPFSFSAHDKANKVQAAQHNFSAVQDSQHVTTLMPLQVFWLPGHAPQDTSVKGQSYSNIQMLRQEVPSPILLSPRSVGTISGTIRKLHGTLDEIPHWGGGACPMPLGYQEVSDFRKTGLHLDYQLHQF